MNSRPGSRHCLESTWLAERSTALRTSSFEVIRCTVDGRVYAFQKGRATPGVPG